jgi:hypothetical protein
MIIERIKFYADTPSGDLNKYHCYNNVSILKLEEVLIRFMSKGYNIRAAWYEKIDDESGEIVENCRINDLQAIFNKAVSLASKKKISH